MAASSSSAFKTCGILILIHRKFPLDIETTGGDDDDGRMTNLLGSWNNIKLALVSLYAPNEFDPAFFPKMTELILNFSEYKLIIEANMNAVYDPALDKSHVTPVDRSSKSLTTFISDLNLCDI